MTDTTVPPVLPARAVPDATMSRVFDAARTPHKFGVVLRPGEGQMLDCPCVYRFGGAWLMLYVCMNKVGYETHLARSDDLLNWTALGKVLPFRDDDDKNWDRWQACGAIALMDPTWGGTHAPRPFDGKYWLSYLGGALQGYETDPLSIGLAHTATPDVAAPWTRLPVNPVLAPSDADARPFEKRTLYKSQIIEDESRSVDGARFVMFYNGKQEGKVGTERIGMAVSDDMVSWRRHGDGPVIDNGPRGISGDPQLVRMSARDVGEDVWVMHYFGHVWKPKAFDTFACSYDLVNWTRWDGEHLTEPTEPWDATFAHKPWVIYHDGVVYHFYCAVGDEGRVIAVAASKDQSDRRKPKDVKR